MNRMYNDFITTKDYSTELQDCIENTVNQLTTNTTNFNSPGMLLGKIQSGKTRTFIGIIALAFDRGYDICVIFTKGTKALAQLMPVYLPVLIYPECSHDSEYCCKSITKSLYLPVQRTHAVSNAFQGIS